jgi:hypothetical protein
VISKLLPFLLSFVYLIDDFIPFDTLVHRPSFMHLITYYASLDSFEMTRDACDKSFKHIAEVSSCVVQRGRREVVKRYLSCVVGLCLGFHSVLRNKRRRRVQKGAFMVTMD